jgi:threonine dehydratase
MSGAKLGIPCTIVMPEGNTVSKSITSHDWEPRSCCTDKTSTKQRTECIRLAALHSLAFVPPYDDPLVIAGQGPLGWRS